MVTKADMSTPAGKQIPLIMSEIRTAAEKLAHIGPAVSVFGSARVSRNSRTMKPPSPSPRPWRRPVSPSSPGAAPHHGSGQQGRIRSGRHQHRAEHQPAARGPQQRIPDHQPVIRVLLLAQGHLFHAQLRLRGDAGRLRHPGRALRSVDADPDRQGAARAHRAGGQRILVRPGRMAGRAAAEQRHDRRPRPEPVHHRGRSAKVVRKVAEFHAQVSNADARYAPSLPA